MKLQSASRIRIGLSFAVTLSLFASLLTSVPSAFAAVTPTIGSVAPNSGTTAGGTSVTITGTDFQIPGFWVQVDGATLSYSNYTNTSVTVITQPHAAGVVAVSVHTDLGTATASYTYVAPATYTMTYLGTSADSGTPPTDPSSPYSSGSTVTLMGGGTLVKAGNTFGGWQDCVIIHVYGTTFTIVGNTTVCPVWTANLVHTVTFNSNFGTPATTTQTASTTTNLTANSFTRPGYTFTSWNTDAAGSGMGIQYLNQASFGFANDMTLFAQWTPNTPHTVTFNSNSGTPVTNTQTSSVPTNLTANSFTRPGYIFTSWSTDPNGGGMGLHFLNGASYDFSADITLYAQWIANITYTITYLGNTNSSGTVPSPTVGSGLVTLAVNTGPLTKTGYSFGGWNTQANGLGTLYATGAAYNLTSDITLYAVWNPIDSITYKIIYGGNGNSGGNVPSPTVGSGHVTLATNSGFLVNLGFTFNGWNTKANGLGTPYAVASIFNLTADITLYAIWNKQAIPTNYTITYNGNGNTGGTSPSPTVGSGTVTLAHNIGGLARTGSAFGGWNTNVANSGTSYSVGSSYNLIADVTLYAVWSTNAIYTITYNGNGNTGGTVPSPTTGSGSITLATNTGGLVKTANTFIGWNLYANGLGTLRAVGSNYLLNTNVILYAIYTPVVVPKNVPDLILNGRIIVNAPPKKIALNQIVPVHQEFLTKLPTNAVGFELYENGNFAISAKSNSVFLKQIVGPKDQVTVIAVGRDGMKSAPSSVAVSKDPISLANINFNTDSYKFIGPATKILDQVAAVMLQHGYTVLEIWGYVDTQGSKASWITLSNNRAKAVKDYMTKKLAGSGVTIKNAGRAQTQAVGNNNTAEGRALNRRVEIRVS